MRVVLAIVWVTLGAGCAARSEIAGASLGGPDGSVDATSLGKEGGTGVDGAVPNGDGGANADAGACVVQGVGVGCAGPGPGDCDVYGCKFTVHWSCGDVAYRGAGACEPPDAGPPSGYYEGVCDDNGVQSSTFQVPTKTCDCKDEAALVTLVQGFCTHQ